MTMMWRRSCRPLLSRQILLGIFGFLFGLLLNAFLFHTTINQLECPATSPESSSHQKPLSKPLLLVGVMTAGKYVDTRAWDVWRTWGQKISGRLLFFVAQDTISQHSEVMPLIRLRGVDDAAYPPQKKSFAMMRWMYDNQLDNYDWFMRADDDLYVRNEKLEKFLRSLDPSKAHMIGQAGLGNTAEYGQLALGAKDNYCMGGPGVIFSREALRAVGPHLEKCLQELLTTHEDVELGRCLRKYVGIACTWNYEMQTLFHNNNQSAIPNIQLNPIDDNFRKMITLHPVKQPEVMRAIHIHAQSLRLNQLRERKMALLKELQAKRPNELVRREVNSSQEVRNWDYASLNKLTFCAGHVNCPRRTMDARMRNATNQIVLKLFDNFNANAQQRGRTLQFQNIQYGYSRVEPRHGVDYILDIVLWFKKFRPPNRATLSVRRHAYVQQTFGPIEAVSEEQYRAHMTANGYSSAIRNNLVYIAVALQGRADTFQKFAGNLEAVLASSDHESVRLVVARYRSGDYATETAIASTLNQLSSFMTVEVVDMPAGGFSRGMALSTAASAVTDSNALMFFTDVDMLMDEETIDRIRLNTVQGAQAYFPIIFSEYSPDFWSDQSNSFANERGYFRHFGFGMVAMYKSDFDLIGGFNTTIMGWGNEDVDLFERSIQSHLRVFRAPDPGLRHIAHSIQCAADLTEGQRKMCIGTKAASLAPMDFLASQVSPYL